MTQQVAANKQTEKMRLVPRRGNYRQPTNRGNGSGKKTCAMSAAILRGRRVEASTQHHELRTSAAISSPRLNIVVKDALDPRIPVAVTSAATLSPRYSGVL